MALLITWGIADRGHLRKRNYVHRMINLAVVGMYKRKRARTSPLYGTIQSVITNLILGYHRPSWFGVVSLSHIPITE